MVAKILFGVRRKSLKKGVPGRVHFGGNLHEKWTWGEGNLLKGWAPSRAAHETEDEICAKWVYAAQGATGSSHVYEWMTQCSTDPYNKKCSETRFEVL